MVLDSLELDMEIIVDIDRTICKFTTEDTMSYEDVEPIYDIIESINYLYDKGFNIIIRTGRGGNTGINWKELTKKQLNEWGVKYHRLEFVKKPKRYVNVDDRNVLPDELVRWYKNEVCNNSSR